MAKVNEILSLFRDIETLSMGGEQIAAGILFGSPSSSARALFQSGSAWEELLKQTVSGGIAGSVSGLFSLGGIGGLGSLVSGIASLFGGTATAEDLLPPLVRFPFPQPQEETAYVGPGGSRIYPGVAVEPPPAAANFTGPIYRSFEVAQAVKNALLHSSSLNDVIAEI